MYDRGTTRRCRPCACSPSSSKCSSARHQHRRSAAAKWSRSAVRDLRACSGYVASPPATPMMRSAAKMVYRDQVDGFALLAGSAREVVRRLPARRTRGVAETWCIVIVGGVRDVGGDLLRLRQGAVRLDRDLPVLRQGGDASRSEDPRSRTSAAVRCGRRRTPSSALGGPTAAVLWRWISPGSSLVGGGAAFDNDEYRRPARYCSMIRCRRRCSPLRWPSPLAGAGSMRSAKSARLFGYDDIRDRAWPILDALGLPRMLPDRHADAGHSLSSAPAGGRQPPPGDRHG